MLWKSARSRWCAGSDAPREETTDSLVNRRPQGFQEYITEQGFHALYIVTTDRNAPLKVGIAQDPSRRLVGLQNANFERLRVHRFWWLPGRPVAARVDRSFKTHFASAAIRGEWFDMPLNVAEAFVEQFIRSIGTWGVGQDEMEKLMEEWSRRSIERTLAQITPGKCLARSLYVRWPISRLPAHV